MKPDGMRITTASFLALAACVALAAQKSWTPAHPQIAELETNIRLERLPEWEAGRSPALAEYQRFYAGDKSKRDDVILGELVLPTEPEQHPGVHVVSDRDEFPMISGGGCSVIHLVYSVRKSTMTSIWCNGSI